MSGSHRHREHERPEQEPRCRRDGVRLASSRPPFRRQHIRQLVTPEIPLLRQKRLHSSRWLTPIARIVFVHGSVMGGRPTWSGQRALAERFELEILERPGFPPNPPVDHVDFEEHASLVADALRRRRPPGRVTRTEA